MRKNIVICMDGTWNDPTEKTNVYKLFRGLVTGAEVAVTGDPVMGRHLRRESDGLQAFYLEGVGAKGRSQGVLGGALGIGLHARVLHGFLLASRAYAKGDKIWIFGFSRGAWSARSLAGFIGKAGLFSAAQAAGATALKDAQDIWLQTKTRSSEAGGDAFWARNDEQPIHLVGVWDTVGALGIPFFNGIKMFDRLEKNLFDFADLELSPRVRFARHALAIDERRKDFVPTLWQPRADGSIRQVWFTGAHADVGGGYAEAGLSNCALKWMADEVNALDANLKVNLGQLAPDPAPDPLQNRHDEMQKAIWKLRPANPRSVARDATLHPGVIRRMEARADYRPDALRGHLEAAAYFKGTPPKEDIFETGERLPAKHIEVGAKVEDEVFSDNCWNAVELEVKPGESYAIAASGRWKDKNNEASASGYDSKNFLTRSVERTRRVRDKPWFCLIACVNADPGLESHNPDAGNRVTGVIQSLTHAVPEIDGKSQLVPVGEKGQVDVRQGGYLYFFANDAAWSYSDNTGSVTITVTRTR